MIDNPSAEAMVSWSNHTLANSISASEIFIDLLYLPDLIALAGGILTVPKNLNL